MRAFSAVGAGKTRRLGRVLAPDGRAVCVAVDHASYLGEGAGHGGGMEAIAAGGPDAVLGSWQVARAYPELLARTGLVLRVDGGSTEVGELPAEDFSGLLHTAEQAMAVGADMVVVLVFPGQADEHVSLRRLAALCSEAELLGLPVMAEVIPGGWGRAVEWSTLNVSRGARIAAELGADVVKTVCPVLSEFDQVVGACPVPVVALGGPKMPSPDAVVDVATAVIAAGAAGVAFGRNVWGAPDPEELIRKLRVAVHGSAA